MVAAVFSRHIIDDFLPPFIAEVDVDIRHADALRVQEPFKQQIVLDGIDVRNSKAVRDNASRRASAPRADHDAVFLGEIYKIPDNEEVIRKTHIINGGKLVIETFPDFIRRVLIAFPKSRLRNMPQVSPVRIPFRYFKLGQVVIAELKFKVALVGDLPRVADRLRHIREKLAHFPGGFQVKFLRLKGHFAGLVDGGDSLDAHQHLLRVSVFPVYIMYVVGRDHLNGKLVRKF